MKSLLLSLIATSILFLGCKSQDVNSRAPASVPGKCQGDVPKSTKPQALLKWMAANNKNKSMEEMICCLPENFRDNYKIVHTSFSAQQSHYKSPRILFGSINDDGMMFSISGGDKSLPQSNSIEVMVDNKQTGELELFDIDMGHGKKHLSGKNPQACITCHGSNGVIKEGGPRPIMNPFPWPRMTTIAHKALPIRENDSQLDTATECKERSKFFYNLEKKVNQSIKDNPRFRCLKPPAERNRMNFILDTNLAEKNMRRVAKEVRATPDFKAVEPFLAAVAFGCFDLSVHHWDTKTLDHFKTMGLKFGQPSSWFKGRLKKQLKRDVGLSTAQKKKLHPKNFTRQLDQARKKFEGRLSKEEAVFKKLNKELSAGKIPILPSGSGLLACDSDLKDMPLVGAYGSLSSLYRDSFGNYLRKEMLDRIATGNVSRVQTVPDEVLTTLSRDALRKWVFESRGIDTRGWSMAIVPEFRSEFGGVFDSLNSDVTKTLTFGHQQSKKSFRKICKKLKKYSLSGGFPERVSEELQEAVK